MVAIPVFPSRVFRHSAIFIREDSDIRELAQLAGRRIGVPQWSQTATVYVRGHLAHDAGVPLSSIEWIQAGVNEPGRKEPAKLQLPPGIRVTPMPDRTLTQMLMDGEIDAAITARPPDPFLKGEPGIRRLFPDFQKEEESYFKRTGIFPIMHIVGVRRTLAEQHPWLPGAVFKAFGEAKDKALELLGDTSATKVTLPFVEERLGEARDLMGEDFWSYGLEANRKTLEVFLRHHHSQGLSSRLVKPEELFHPGTLESFKL